MYTGPSTEEAPMPSPPMKRKTISEGQLQARALPMAEAT